MSRDGVVVADHLWKRFSADRRRSVVRHEMERIRARVRGEGPSRYRWALKDINLRLELGESLGLVGANGSGKSTLLKILCRVMYPYAGRVDVHGRVGALIEVSSGIHPQLTGRENTYLYGSLLGLRRKEVSRRFDDIVAFAEVETAIDRQVKFYSSGMKMRLGFAVAAFLEPDVLLVDEVLAVGDASFQQKCLERMGEVLAQGSTLVFVSHDLAAVEATCARGMWLNQGVVEADGPIGETLTTYRRSIELAAEVAPHSTGFVQIRKVEVTGPEGGMPKTQERLEATVVLESPGRVSTFLHLGVSEGPSSPIFTARRDLDLDEGETTVRCNIERLPLARGRYYLWLGMRRGGAPTAWHPAAQFDVSGPVLEDAYPAVVRLAPVHVDVNWDVTRP